MTLELRHAHPWNVSPREAVAIQNRLRGEVVAYDDLPVEISRVAGVDVGFEQQGGITRAAVAVLSHPELDLVEYRLAWLPTAFPYVPGLLSFRELPAILAALDGLNQLPDMLLVDGQGLAHPRRFGIACHLGVLTGLPVIGVAKTRLTGSHATLPLERGARVPLLDEAVEIGTVLRNRAGVRPIYISVGHRISLASAVDWVLRCTTRYRLPETTRWAHRLASH